jgi:drug/metabolite transporter (DMT)-like permease
VSWALLSISAALIFAIVSIIDKFLLTKWIKNPIILPLVLSMIGLLVSLIIYLFYGFSFLAGLNIILALINGTFYIFAEIFYYKAAKTEEISKVIPLLYLSPLFILILADIFLGEIFTPMKYFGIFLLVAGAIFISSKNFTKINFNKAFLLAVFSALMFAILAILTKYLLNFADFWTIFSYIRLGTFLATIPVFFFYLKDFAPLIQGTGLKSVGFLIFNAVLLLAGILLLTIATADGPVTLVSALTSFQPFFTFILATSFTIFFPSILKEEINKSFVFQKISAIILIFIGTLLVV